ncbi:HAMP domain-containing protein [bacterium]|nr:HAMP domain-containing protein [bacterium]
MKTGITQRLFLAILAAAFLSVVSMFLIVRWNIDRGFTRYVNSLEQTRMARLTEELADRYAARENWNFLKNDAEEWRRLLAASLPEDALGAPGRGLHPPLPGGPADSRARPGAPPLPPPLAKEFDRRIFLLDAGKRPLIAPPNLPATAETRPILLRNRVIGYLGLLPRKRLSDELQLRFLKEQQLALSMVAGMLVLVAAGLSLPLANRLVRPIRALAAATGRLAAGEFGTRVSVESSDELGRLARDFNALAVTLEKNELSRRRWVADISHELRTPLAILRGEIEALQDGVRELNPEAINSLHGEVLRLGRLVDDLYQLSLSDLGALTYRKENVDLSGLLQSALAPYRQEFAAKCIRLTEDIPRDAEVPLFADAERLRQLVANLLDNALKYTDAGGEVAIRLGVDGGMAVVEVEDSAPGVAEGDLERLFDRLYRVEASRNRSAGGAGLGLAICRNIVEAQGGSITARQSTLGGIVLRVELSLREGSL